MPQNIIFYLDESGFDIEIQREYGYGKKSERLLAEKSGNIKGKRVSVVGVRDNNHNLLHPLSFKGTIDKELFKKVKFKVISTQIKIATLPKMLIKFKHHKNKKDLLEENHLKIG